MEIIKLASEHSAAIAALEEICFSTPWSENAILHEVTNPISYWLVAVENGQVLGYVGSQYGYGEADMMNLAVVPDFRKRGIGQLLVAELISHLDDLDVKSLTLEVRQSNAAAVSLYDKMGFQQVGLRPNYYQKPRESALILRKEW
jgi:ribosomal-protein-alanine N-acetyltransferase